MGYGRIHGYVAFSKALAYKGKLKHQLGIHFSGRLITHGLHLVHNYGCDGSIKE